MVVLAVPRNSVFSGCKTPIRQVSDNLPQDIVDVDFDFSGTVQCEFDLRPGIERIRIVLSQLDVLG